MTEKSDNPQTPPEPDPKVQALISESRLSKPKTFPPKSRAGNSAPSRRGFNLSLLLGWGGLAACGVALAAMLPDFLSPKVLKEPKKLYRVGRPEDFANSDTVYEQFKPQGFWIVNLSPTQSRLVALSTTCTHLGCIPNWLAGDQKFKCPCHGSGYFVTGVNFEGPAPRPLDRFAIYKDAEGFLMVDMSRTFRSELGQWDDPRSFVAIS